MQKTRSKSTKWSSWWIGFPKEFISLFFFYPIKHWPPHPTPSKNSTHSIRLCNSYSPYIILNETCKRKAYHLRAMVGCVRRGASHQVKSFEIKICLFEHWLIHIENVYSFKSYTASHTKYKYIAMDDIQNVLQIYFNNISDFFPLNFHRNLYGIFFLVIFKCFWVRITLWQHTSESRFLYTPIILTAQLAKFYPRPISFKLNLLSYPACECVSIEPMSIKAFENDGGKTDCYYPWMNFKLYFSNDVAQYTFAQIPFFQFSVTWF